MQSCYFFRSKTSQKTMTTRTTTTGQKTAKGGRFYGFAVDASFAAAAAATSFCSSTSSPSSSFSTSSLRTVRGGTFGTVFVDADKKEVVKRAKCPQDASLNREVIAWNRLLFRRSDSESDVHDAKASTHPAFTPVLRRETLQFAGLAFCHSLAFSYAGRPLLEFSASLALDPVDELLLPLLEALAFLEERNVVHGEVNPDNLCAQADRSGAVSIKLVDFGSSVVLSTQRPWTKCSGYLVDDETGLPSSQSTAPICEGEQNDSLDKNALHHLCNVPYYREPLANALLVVATREVRAKSAAALPSLHPLAGLRVDCSSDVHALALCCFDMCVLRWPCWENGECLRDLETAKRHDAVTKAKATLAACRRNPTFDGSSVFACLSRRFSWLDADQLATLAAVEYSATLEYPDHPGFFLDFAEVHGRKRTRLFRDCLRQDPTKRHHFFSRPREKEETPTTINEERENERKKRDKSEKEEKSKARSSCVFVSRVEANAKRLDEGGSRWKIDVTLGRCWVMTGVVECGKLVWFSAAGYAGQTRGGRHSQAVIAEFIKAARKVDPLLASLSPERWTVVAPRQSSHWRAILALHQTADRSPGDD